MMLIACPYCGPRDESELRWGGEAGVRRPAQPDLASDRAWARYLFFRANTEGQLVERWFCATGCRRWFCAARDTVTNEITATWPLEAS